VRLTAVRPPVLLHVAAACLLAGIVAACGSDAPQRTEGAYCAAVGEQQAALGAPVIATEDDIDATLRLYRDMAAKAPIAVEEEWNVMVTAIETASTVDPADPASAQLAADTARQSTQAAKRVVEYTQQKCGVTIGNVPVTSPPTSLTPDTATPATGANTTAATATT
jgi:hypothetical protein